MPEYLSNKPGSFCWIELSTTDATAARSFYTSLFGWVAGDIPMGGNRVYTMMQLKGKAVAGLLAQEGQQSDHAVPSHWFTYISVKDADDVARKAGSVGGKVVAPPSDVPDGGRMAVISDPAGAVFGIWQPGKPLRAFLKMEPNSLTWTELQTHDIAGAMAYYEALFGWTARTDDGGYTEFICDEAPHAGMIEIRKEWGLVPPNWGVYFLVDECDATISAAEKLGARVIVPPTDIDGVGRFGTLSDPTGAVFSVIHLV